MPPAQSCRISLFLATMVPHLVTASPSRRRPRRRGRLRWGSVCQLLAGIGPLELGLRYRHHPLIANGCWAP